MPGNTPNLGIPYPLGTDRVMDGDDVIRQITAQMDSLLGAAWVPFTPTITTGGSAIVVGNGVHSSAYEKVGRAVFFHCAFTAGSSTNWGSGSLILGLPVPANPAVNAMVCPYVQLSPGRFGFLRANTATGLVPYLVGGSGIATVADLGLTTTSILQWSGIYESAA